MDRTRGRAIQTVDEHQGDAEGQYRAVWRTTEARGLGIREWLELISLGGSKN